MKASVYCGFAAMALAVSAAGGAQSAEDVLPLTLREAPIYPAHAWKAQAACLVVHDILNSGAAVRVRACCRTSPDGGALKFERAAVEAVSGWRYVSADGDPSATQRIDYHTIMVFQLPDVSAPPPEAPEPGACVEELSR